MSRAADHGATPAPVCVRLVGGLGNQLFQYATARAVALRNKAELVLDARAYSAAPAPAALARNTHRSFDLQHFAIAAQIGREEQLPPPRSRRFCYYRWRYFGRHPRFKRQRGHGFNPSVLALGTDVYLHGYFQSERYFAEFADTLHRELRIGTPPSAENARWLDDIRAGPSVSLHVRRGDYVSTSGVRASFGTCSPDYYRRALARIRERSNTDPTVYVFSDEPGWVRDNLTLGAPMRVIGHNGGTTAYEDMRLMSACTHHVIANSSFSWWGAWLDSNPKKCVVAPKRWFNDRKLANPDIVPETWETL